MGRSTLEFDLDTLGYGADELRLLLAADNASYFDSGDIPFPAYEAVARPGDLNDVGIHGLLCGNGANAQHVD